MDVISISTITRKDDFLVIKGHSYDFFTSYFPGVFAEDTGNFAIKLFSNGAYSDIWKNNDV